MLFNVYMAKEKDFFLYGFQVTNCFRQICLLECPSYL